MSRHALLALIAALALAGCLPQPSTPVNVDDLVATSVSGTLAVQATASSPPPTQPLVTVDTPIATSPPSATEPPTLIPSTETTTPTATSPATTTPTPIAGDPRTALGQPAWRDTFSSATGWNIGEDSFTKAEVEDGQFVLTGLTTADGWRVTWPEVESAYLEVDDSHRTARGRTSTGSSFACPTFTMPVKATCSVSPATGATSCAPGTARTWTRWSAQRLHPPSRQAATRPTASACGPRTTNSPSTPTAPSWSRSRTGLPRRRRLRFLHRGAPDGRIHRQVRRDRLLGSPVGPTCSLAEKHGGEATPPRSFSTCTYPATQPEAARSTLPRLSLLGPVSSILAGRRRVPEDGPERGCDR